MYEYHGWITVVYSIWEVEDEDEKLETAVNYARDLIEQTLPKRYINELKVVNGEYMISLAGLANHRGTLEDDLINVFREIGEKAPGSYGLAPYRR